MQIRIRTLREKGWTENPRLDSLVRARLGCQLPSLGLSQDEIKQIVLSIEEPTDMIKSSIRKAIEETWGNIP